MSHTCPPHVNTDPSHGIVFFFMTPGLCAIHHACCCALATRLRYCAPQCSSTAPAGGQERCVQTSRTRMVMPLRVPDGLVGGICSPSRSPSQPPLGSNAMLSEMQPQHWVPTSRCHRQGHCAGTARITLALAPRHHSSVRTAAIRL